MTDAEFKDRVLAEYKQFIESIQPGAYEELADNVADICEQELADQQELQSFADDCESCKL